MRITTMQIKKLFDPTKDIYRTIEKVITYQASQEARLKDEITEYIVTDSIEEQYEDLLSKMQLAMETGGENEIGVWVSGFYGSGKSSFTKYLGLALDENVQIEGTPFLKYLQDRLNKPTTRALLATVASRFPAAVVLLDLASEMLAGATMEEVSTVLYYKVLQWAGYSQNLKVAAFERKLKRDGRYDEFCTLIQSTYNFAWQDVQNDALVIDSLIPGIAHQMYPQLFKTDTSFNTEAGDFIRFENDRVQEMIDIAREATGKEHILFIIDEVGQYVSARPNLILNLDGLAKNLKSLGQSKVWIIGTAQQTLTEDDPRASLNSPELYKLKDRFPIQIDLESRDIKEICYRRLLGKSPEGERALKVLFDQHGQALRHNTRLQDAKYYDADFDRAVFTNLYPFLPAHFDILLHLLGALARSTGGIGLRSAIKVVQDILIEGSEGKEPVANRPVGWLATTLTLYDSLEKDIRRAAPSIHAAVDKALIRFFDSPLHQEIAKTVAILQILGNMPVNEHNVASLIHPALDAPSRAEQVSAAVGEMISDGLVPFGRKDGQLCFFSEKINDIELERTQIPLRSIETRRIQNEALRELFNPLPRITLNGSLSVTSGLKAENGGVQASLAGERETIQTVVELAAPPEYEDARARLVDESRQRSAQHTISLLGRAAEEVDRLVGEIFRNREIAQRHRSDPDQEVREYCTAQLDLAARLTGDLQHLLKKQLSQGSFIFRGQTTAAESLDPDLGTAAKKLLSEVAGQVFNRYNEAPARADTGLAEKFLRVNNLRAISAELDPLGLVQVAGGAPQIHREHKALVSIRDYLERHGSVDGKRLSDHFTGAPFGWSPDTLRYLLAALLVAGEIRLRISGRETHVNGQLAIDGLRTNNAFKTVGVSLREGPIPPEVLANAALRLADLSGETVIPLEQEISKAAVRCFAQCQQQYGSLEERMKNLGLPGSERVRSLNQELAALLETDASEAPQKLGSEESALYADLVWVGEVHRALANGLETTIQDLRAHWKDIRALPAVGAPGALRQEVEEALQGVSGRLGEENFYRHQAELNSALREVKNLAAAAARKMADEQVLAVRESQEALQKLYEWTELTQSEQKQILGQLDALAVTAAEDLQGLKLLINQQYIIQAQGTELREQIQSTGQERQMKRLKEEQRKAEEQGRTRISRSVRVSQRLTRTDELEDLIRQLQALKSELALYSEIDITIELKD